MERSGMTLEKVDAAFFACWPAREEHVLCDWSVRISEGYTKRANSVTVSWTAGPASELLQCIKAAEQRYAQAGLPAVFRIVDAAAGRATLEEQLHQLGYRQVDPSAVFYSPVRDLPPREIGMRGPLGVSGPHAVDLHRWADIYGSLAGLSHAECMAHEAIMHRLARRPSARIIPALMEDAAGAVSCCALMAVDGWFAGLFNLLTAPHARRRGLGRAMIGWLRQQAQYHGAQGLWLQMFANNVPARNLYAGIGFSEAYQYAYWVKP